MKIGYLMQAGVPDLQAPLLAGPALHVKHVFTELQAVGHQVCLLACFAGRLWKSTDLQVYQPVTVRLLDQGPLRWFERAARRLQHELKLPYAAFFESLRFALACRQELADCDLFYERMGWMGYGGGLAAQWLHIPLVWEVNGDHMVELETLGMAPQGSQKWLSLQGMQQAAHRATHTVTTGVGWRQRFIERWRVAPDVVTVIENGSEVVNLLHREQLQAFQAGSTTKRRVTVAYVGGFEPWHGLMILLRAVAKAIAQDIQLRLLLIGSGTEQAKLEQLIQTLQLTQVVCLTGQVNATQLAHYLAQADMGVSPYCGRVEYSGLKLLDYKAAGLAIIASGAEGQPALLTHDQTGWIVPPCDENALCDALVQLCQDGEKRVQMARAARIEAEQLHSWQHTAQELTQLFTQVIRS